MFINVIFLLAVYCFVVFFWNYCNDDTPIWQDDYSPSLTQPTIADLSPQTPNDILQRYEKEVIFPAHEYFNNLLQIKQYHKQIADEGIISCAIQIILAWPIVSALGQTDLIPYPWICYVIVFIVCFLCSVFLIPSIYKRSHFRFKGEHLYNNLEWLDSVFDEVEKSLFEKYLVSNEKERNNYYIEMHSQYVHTVMRDIKERQTMRRIVAAFIFGGFLVFMILPH